jgi:hypothetical protein
VTSAKWASAALFVAVLAAPPAFAQGRGGGPPAPQRAPRDAAPTDLTGTWVSVISEDWQWRMQTPAPKDYASVPMTPAARKVADTWTTDQDGSCKAFGAPAVMRHPGRVRISWQDAQTLKIETDAGVQTRLLRFGPKPATLPAPSLQGYSVAEWQGAAPVPAPNAAAGAATKEPSRVGSLKVTTTNLTAGWLRRNGIPYSENTVLTEYFDRFTDGTSEWFSVTTMVEDLANLTMPFVISSNFKKEADDTKWTPVPCRP